MRASALNLVGIRGVLTSDVAEGQWMRMLDGGQMRSFRGRLEEAKSQRRLVKRGWMEVGQRTRSKRRRSRSRSRSRRSRRTRRRKGKEVRDRMEVERGA